MTDQRKAELLEQILAWAAEHDTQFMSDMFDQTDATDEEIIELGFDVGY